jgi:hypothetical protein
LKETISIDDFSITQTSLDDVFVSFALASEENVDTVKDEKAQIAENGSAESFKKASSRIQPTLNGTHVENTSV